MPIDLTRTFRAAVAQLEQERDTIDRQIAAIQKVLGSDSVRRRRARRGRVSSPRPRRRMSAVARRAVSQRMKAYWAERRGLKKSAKAKTPGRRARPEAATTPKPAPQTTGKTTATRQKRNQKKKAA